MRLRRQPEITLSSPVVHQDTEELNRKLDSISAKMDAQKAERIEEKNEAALNEAAARHAMREADASDRREDVKELEKMQKEAAEEGKVEGGEAVTLKKMADTGTDIAAVEHAEHELLRRGNDQEEREEEVFENEAEREELATKERDEQDEKMSKGNEPQVVTDEDLSLEDSEAAAFDTAEQEINSTKDLTSQVMDEERDEATKDLEKATEASDDELEKSDTVGELNGEKPSKPEASAMITGAMDHPCPCIEEMMEQPCPAKKEVTGAAAEKPGCSEILAKVTAEEKLRNAEESIKKIVKHPEGLEGGPLIVKRSKKTTTAEDEEEEEA